MEPEVVRILRCPITRGDLRQLTAQEIGAVNGRIAEGGVRYVGGEQVKRRLDEALVSSDGRYGYPVEDGIAVLLSDRAIELRSGDAGPSTAGDSVSRQVTRHSTPGDHWTCSTAQSLIEGGLPGPGQ